jgi:hypothetical protein
LEQIKGNGIPTFNLGNTEIPFSSEGHPYVWALANPAILAAEIVGYLSATRHGKHRGNDYAGEGKTAKAAGLV